MQHQQSSSAHDSVRWHAVTGRDVRTMRERVERRLWRTAKVWVQRLGTVRPKEYTFVAGMQRSGTNMLMELLEWSLWTDVYHETDSRAFANYEMRPPEVIRATVTRSPAPRIVIKALCELDLLPRLMDTFAPARTLWVLRSLDDTVNSAIRSFGDFADLLHRMARDPMEGGWRGRGMSADTAEMLRRIDHAHINEATAAAVMWYYRNVLFFELGLDQDPRVRLIRYEDLVREPARLMREIFEFLSIEDWSPWVVRHVHPRSVGKSPPAPIETTVRRLCDGLRDRFDAIAHADELGRSMSVMAKK